MISGVAFADPEQQFVSIGDFELQSGQVIIDAKVGYRVAGKLNADKSNVMVMPSWHMGATIDLFESDLIGPGFLADTDQYFVIAVDALADGVSSSPSNSPDQPGKQFPQVTLTDMVTAQHVALTQHLGITHVL